MNDELAGRVKQLYWHQSIDLGGGVVTAGAKSLKLCNGEANVVFDRVNLAERTVLDVGAWNGFFSFEAKRRGAARVLATDSYCWSHPNFRGRETFDLARTALGLQVDAMEVDVARLSKETVGEFDIVLYLGVFYHRYDAIEALAAVAPLAKHVLIVETHLDLRDISRPAMAFYPASELAGDDTCWWAPNEHCMRALLLGHGFSEVEISATPGSRYERAVFHAWRTTDARVRPLPRADRLKSTNFLSRFVSNARRYLLGGMRSRSATLSR